MNEPVSGSVTPGKSVNPEKSLNRDRAHQFRQNASTPLTEPLSLYNRGIYGFYFLLPRNS
jgi:hypothetical protein